MPPLQPDNLNIRFAAISGVGTIHHLFRDTMRLANKGACMAVILLSALMLNRHLGETACWPFRVPILHHSRIDNKAGISYRPYLPRDADHLELSGHQSVAAVLPVASGCRPDGICELVDDRKTMSSAQGNDPSAVSIAATRCSIGACESNRSTGASWSASQASWVSRP
jgi:hypothetical protein